MRYAHILFLNILSVVTFLCVGCCVDGNGGGPADSTNSNDGGSDSVDSSETTDQDSNNWPEDTTTKEVSCPTPKALECSDGWILCNGTCINPLYDDANCGVCENTCANGTRCNGGTCGCRKDQLLCNGSCVDTSWDLNNCGACGLVCKTGQFCTYGYCVETCDTAAPDMEVCGSECTDTWWDPDNCGNCDRKCSGNHIVTRECYGDCDGQCVNGYADCNGRTDLDGCEINIKDNPNHCGACGVKCNGKCVNGVCK